MTQLPMLKGAIERAEGVLADADAHDYADDAAIWLGSYNFTLGDLRELLSAASRDPEAAKLEMLVEAIDAGALDSLRYVLNFSDSNSRVSTIMRTFTLPDRITTHDKLERLYSVLTALGAANTPEQP